MNELKNTMPEGKYVERWGRFTVGKVHVYGNRYEGYRVLCKGMTDPIECADTVSVKHEVDKLNRKLG